MKTLGALLARKTAVPENRLAPEEAAPPAEDPLELDEELFAARGARLGEENETLRNLLLDASAKIEELDGIKTAVSRLVDPVGKALRVIESERSEKIALQTVLNNTRAAYGKARAEAAELEKKAAAAEGQCRVLRQELAAVQSRLAAAEANKADSLAEITALRTQNADLENRLAQETSECKALRDEKQRLDERVQSAEKRLIGLESELNGARQRLQMAEDEKRAQQALLEKASADAARLSRRLAEMEAALAAAQGRLRHVEADLAQLSGERTRLANALDEAHERHDREMTSQRMRFEALQARAQASEKLLGEAREHLLARAEEIRERERRLNELALARDTLQARLSEIETERAARETAFDELERGRRALAERAASLVRAFAAKEAALERSEATVAALNERVAALETALAGEKQRAEDAAAELNAALRRERMERSVVEGALETARKDFARAMRELTAMQRRLAVLEAEPIPTAANAA
ncbi:MAG: hypothetical protein IRY89_15835 [Pseudolabrys sp.]|nr:hypothetical protein [Pseudolabrys sp.]